MADRIDIERMAEQAVQAEQAAQAEGDGGGGYSALPGVVRELIRTPGFKELLMLHLRDINPDNARELVKAAIWEDVVFTMSALGASPKMVNWLVEALIELGVQLNNFTLEILRDFMVQLGRDLDIEKLRELPAAYAPLVNELLLDDREALDGLIAGLGVIADELARAGERTWRKIWNTADFGKIRVGLTAHLEERRAELAGEADIFSPVAISNLLGVVPPLANFTLRVLTRTLQALGLPAEILANAVFQLLEDIDMSETGGLINALAGVVNTLHRGNLVLGRDEPRFKEVLGRVSRDLVDNVDGEAFKEMLIALKEDGAVIGSVLADYAYATPEATAQLVRGVYLAVGAALRTVAETARKLSELPPSAFESMAESFAEAVDPRELGRIINYQALMFNKMSDAKPEILEDFVGKLLASLDTEELAAAGKAAALQVTGAALADPTVKAALEPEAVAAVVNASLANFNRFTRDHPDLIREYVKGVVNALDTTELGLAAKGLAGQMSKALLKDTDVVMNEVKRAAKLAAVGTAVLFALGATITVIRKLRK